MSAVLLGKFPFFSGDLIILLCISRSCLQQADEHLDPSCLLESTYPLFAIIFTVLTMPASNQGWPEEFGFQIGGNGPSYILTVEEGSSAQLSGLQPGDQVLEIEGQNVSSLGAQEVIALAQSQRNIPPSIGVVSRIQQVGQ